MSDKWDVKDTGPVSSGAAAKEALTLGLYAAEHRFEATNKETGETRSVNAYTSSGAGKKIEKGKFND